LLASGNGRWEKFQINGGEFANLHMACFVRVRTGLEGVQSTAMNRKDRFRWVLTAGICALSGVLMLMPCGARSEEAEDTFPVLTIGTRTYTNVTVTTKAKKYVMLMHSQGLANIKVSELTPEQRRALGYREEEKPKNRAAEATKWAKKEIASLNVNIGQVKALGQNFKEKWDQRAPGELPYVGEITPQMKYGAAGGLLLFWLIGCACLRTICKKTGNEPGVLIWLPIFQLLPMLDAAKMSRLWILGSPFGLTHIVWCFQIAKARGKSGFTGFCLLFPLTSVFAFLYLTFAEGGRKRGEPEKERARVEIMTLETA